MGWCHEFGPQLSPDCGHPMIAGEAACSCPECGLVCSGKFSGCEAVWQAGPKFVEPRTLSASSIDVKLRRKRQPPSPETSGPANSETADRTQPRRRPETEDDRSDTAPVRTGPQDSYDLSDLRSDLEAMVNVLQGQAEAISTLTKQVENLHEIAFGDLSGNTPRHVLGPYSSDSADHKNGSTPEEHGNNKRLGSQLAGPSSSKNWQFTHSKTGQTPSA